MSKLASGARRARGSAQGLHTPFLETSKRPSLPCLSASGGQAVGKLPQTSQSSDHLENLFEMGAQE